MIKLKLQLFGGRGSKSGLGVGGPGIGVATVSKTSKQSKVTKGELNALMSVARQNEPSITKDLKDITHGLSGEIDYKTSNGKRALDYRLKSEESLERKINTDLKEKTKEEVLNSIYDNVRYTYQVRDINFVSEYKQIINELEAKGYVIRRVKNKFVDENSNYRGLNLVVENPNGYKFELQFHTPQSLEVKDINHKLYEIYREDTTSLERKKELDDQMLDNARKLKPIPRINEIKDCDYLKHPNTMPKKTNGNVDVVKTEDNQVVETNNISRVETNSLNTKKQNSEKVINNNSVTDIKYPNVKYYDIDENLARNGHNAYSMSTYIENSTTIRYKRKIDEVYEVAYEAIKKCNGDTEKENAILRKADLYARQYAEWINKDNELHIKYPSQLITGAGGWTPSKLEKRDKAYDSHMRKLDDLDKIISDIEYIPVKTQRHEKQGAAVNSEKFKSEHFKVIQNEEANRLQLVFEEIPDAQTRSILKKNGFKWSPSNSAWQRQLTPNARYAMKDVDEAITKIKNKK